VYWSSGVAQETIYPPDKYTEGKDDSSCRNFWRNDNDLRGIVDIEPAFDDDQATTIAHNGVWQAFHEPEQV
jgi:chemotaxis signal transduction protein